MCSLNFGRSLPDGMRSTQPSSFAPRLVDEPALAPFGDAPLALGGTMLALGGALLALGDGGAPASAAAPRAAPVATRSPSTLASAVAVPFTAELCALIGGPAARAARTD